MRPIRILIFSQLYLPEIGALSVRTNEHATRWVAAGHRVTVICQTPNHPHGRIYPGFRNRLLQRTVEAGVDVVRVGVIPLPNRKPWERMVNYASYALTAFLAALRTERPDVVIGSSPQLLTALSAWLVARLRRVPFIFEVRDLWPESIAEAGESMPSLIVRGLARAARFLYRRADRIVVVTPAFRAYLEQERLARPEKLAVVPNAMDLALITSEGRETEQLRAMHGLEDCCVVSYVGALGIAHGLDTILEAARRLKETRGLCFLLVGDGADRERLERRAAEMQLTNVRFERGQSRERALDYLAMADISLVLLRAKPVFKTVIPTKLLESMAMECPVVLGVEGEARWVLEAADAGIAVEPESAEQLANAILRLMERPLLRAEYGKRGRAYVVAHFDRDRMAGRFLRILDELCPRDES